MTAPTGEPGPMQLPFSAVVGLDDAKLALIVSAVDRRVGGVLLRGEKGSAKSTLARGVAALLPGSAPFVELPLGATEDRVVGTLDLAAALTGGEQRFSPGLLAAADGGVLYVDEINLLPDHLVDVLLDAAASGVNRVEREGISHVHPSRFLLIGSMNPEEGDLRPQLLDRFGLAVEVRAAGDPKARAAAVRLRLAFDEHPEAVVAAVATEEATLRRRLSGARPASLPEELLEAVSSLCVSVGAEGLRADLTICRAAAALAGWEGRPTVEVDDVRRVAPLALAHRSRRDPLEPAGMDEQRLSEAFDEHLGATEGAKETVEPDRSTGGRSETGGVDRGDAPDGPGGTDGTGGAGVGDPGGAGAADSAGGRSDVGGLDARDAGERAPARPDPGRASAPSPLPAGMRAHRLASPASGRGRGDAESRRGRQVGDRSPEGPIASVAVAATVRHAAARIAAAGGPPAGEALVAPGDVREARRQEHIASLIVLAVDASGSMGAPDRMEAAKGAVLGLLTDAYRRRDLVGLVAFRGERADIILRPTGSVEVARARLAELPTGGRTPLGAGITTALALATAPARASSHRPRLVVVTDGRATSAPAGGDPLEAALAAADAVRVAGVDTVIIDLEPVGASFGQAQLGLARDLANRMGARYVPLTSLDSTGLRGAISIS